MFEALQITGTSLGLWQAGGSGTKRARQNIARGFHLSSTLSHLCLNQPSAIWNPPHCISLLNAFPQSFSTVPYPEAPLSVLHIATRKNKQKKKGILLHHQNATETVTDEGALWLFSASDYSHDTSVKTCERPVLVRISVWCRVTLGEEATPSAMLAELLPSKSACAWNPDV